MSHADTALLVIDVQESFRHRPYWRTDDLPDFVDRLQALIDGHARALAADSTYAWSPLDFELALIEATGNTWLYDVEVMLRDAWLSLSGGLRASVSRHSEWLAEHLAILASVRSRNALQAQRLVMAHVSFERFEDDLHAPRPAKGRAPRRRRAT